MDEWAAIIMQQSRTQATAHLVTLGVFAHDQQVLKIDDAVYDNLDASAILVAILLPCPACAWYATDKDLRLEQQTTGLVLH